MLLTIPIKLSEKIPRVNGWMGDHDVSVDCYCQDVEHCKLFTKFLLEFFCNFFVSFNMIHLSTMVMFDDDIALDFTRDSMKRILEERKQLTEGRTPDPPS